MLEGDAYIPGRCLSPAANSQRIPVCSTNPCSTSRLSRRYYLDVDGQQGEPGPQGGCSPRSDDWVMVGGRPGARDPRRRPSSRGTGLAILDLRAGHRESGEAHVRRWLMDSDGVRSRRIIADLDMVMREADSLGNHDLAAEVRRHLAT